MTLDDADGDGLVGAGDAILGGESNPVHYAEEDRGTPTEVALDYRRTPEQERLFEGLWDSE